MKIFGSIEGLAAGLDYHMARHNLLAANLANVDTPGFRAQDLKRTDTFEGALQVELAATEPGHIRSSENGLHTKVIVDTTTPADADGNSVSLDKEVVKISTNHMRYETIGTLTASALQGLAWAAADGRGA
jgi:flagellar basal-body rod protein FlgB